MAFLKNRSALLLLSLSVLMSQPLWAQKDDCEQVLNHALEEFNAGHFYGIPAMLKSCIDNGFTREQNQRAYLLLAETYLLIDDPIAAEDSYLKLLKANPEFVTDDARDPIDVVYLSKKFTASPIFSFYGSIGPNVTVTRVIHPINTFSDQNLKDKFIIKPGVQICLGADYNFNEKISFSAGLQYMFTGYEHLIYNINGRDQQDMYDKQNWLNIPLSVKYSFNNLGRFKPYAYIGYSTNFLLADKAIIKNSDRNVTQDGNESVQESTSPNLDLTYKRNLWNRSAFIGGGVRKKLGLDYVFADLRYSFGLRNITNTKRNYSENNTDQDFELLMLYGHVDDYLRLDNLSISIGYIHPLYKPRKLKTARTSSLARKIRKNR